MCHSCTSAHISEVKTADGILACTAATVIVNMHKHRAQSQEPGLTPGYFGSYKQKPYFTDYLVAELVKTDICEDNQHKVLTSLV